MADTVSALRGIAASLERRRERIAKARHGLDVLTDAYSLVAADLRAAAAARDERHQEEPAQ